MDPLQCIEVRGRFNAAWRKRDAEETLRRARELRAGECGLVLMESLRVVILLAHDDHPLFEESAKRWLDQVEAECEPVEAKIAAAALEGLQGPLNRKCEIVLRRLMSGEFPPGHRLDDMDPPAGRESPNG
jgi:hypothetical protein